MRYTIGKVKDDWIVMKNGEPDSRFKPFRDDITFKAVSEVLEELERIDRVKEHLPHPLESKSIEIRKLINQLYPSTDQLLKEAKCPLCAKPIQVEEFRDSLSRREYGISGMCQACQDDVWGPR